MRRSAFLVALGLVAAPLATAGAQQFYYPAKGQGAEQQEKDKYACYEWAKGQSGFDPMAPPTTSTPPPRGGNESLLGGALVGGAGGAAIGAVGGAIAGHGKAGKGAAIGSATGGLLGLMGAAGENSRSSEKRKEWERREAQQYATNRGSYNNAFAACMKGRGYTVN